MNPAEFANIARCERDLWWYRGMRKILFGALDPWMTGRKLQRVLEVGCGTGYLSQLMQNERGWPVVPVDYSREGLAYARRMGVRRPVQADVRALPFASRAFDLVLAIDMLAHLPRGEEQDAARELARVVAPGGLLVVRASAFDFLRSRHSEFVLERQRFTRARLNALLSGAGFRILRSTYANSLLVPVAAAKFRVWEPLSRAPAHSGVEPVAPWLDRVLHAPLALEAKWIGAGRNLPVGQSLVWIGERLS